MAEFLGNMYSWFSFIPRITFTNLVEILILTVLIYEVFLWVQNTRTGVLLKGGLVIIAFYLLAALFHLNTMSWSVSLGISPISVQYNESGSSALLLFARMKFPFSLSGICAYEYLSV